MKKILTFLTAMTFVVSTTSSMITCQKEEKKELNKENIHEQIKAALSEPLEFNDDWIIDYDNTSEKNLYQFVTGLSSSVSWSYLSKTVSYLALEKLKVKIPKLFDVFPNFTLSSAIAIGETGKITNALLNHEQIKFYYDFHYSLNQMQNFDFTKWNIVRPGVGIIQRINCIGGEYAFLHKNGNGFQLNFNQKSFITDSKKRFDYLFLILNATPSIKIFNENYRSFALLGPTWVEPVHFKKTDFPEDLIKILYKDPLLLSTDLDLKEKIESNLKINMFESSDIKNIKKFMPTIFNDVEIDIELVKTYLQSEIKNDEILNKVYGSETFPNGMLLLKIKTKLKNDDILSTKSIDEVIALNIDYK